MKVLGVIAVLVAVLAGLWWWSESGVGEKPVEVSPGERFDAPSEPRVEPPGGPSPSPEITRSEVELDPVGEEREGLTAATSRVFGRVVDASGAGLSEVKIRLHSVGKWAEGVSEEELEAWTDEDGSFELEVPLPTSERVSMTLKPSRFHAFTGRDFDEHPLAPGDNDLGTFTLASTGAIAGSVRGANGAVPARGRVRLDGSFPGGYVIGGPVEEDGRYVIGHVPPGTYDIEAIATGFLTGRLDSIEVHANEVSEGNDFVLEPAPAISGRVVDEEGAPIEGVRVWGWPVGSGQGAGARTDAEGRFIVYLPQDEAYSLEVGKLGYESIRGRFGEESLTFEPGASGVELVLPRTAETTFVVLSEASGEPVERFGMWISQAPGQGLPSSTEKDGELVQDLPGGVVTLFAGPGDQYSIQAPGFAPRRESVAHDSPESQQQTIRLKPEGRMRGRVLFAGEPADQAVVHVERGRFLRPDAPPPEERGLFDDGMGHDLDPYVGRRRALTTDERGVFEIGELATGTYRVELSAAVGSPRSEEGLRVTAGETLELGDLELIAGATVRGRVVVGVGASAPGLEVFLDVPGGPERTTVAADGTFEFRGLAPGEHSLIVEDTPGIVLDMKRLALKVASGETKDVVLDLIAWQPCRVRVHVREADAPLAGVAISLRGEGRGRRGRIGTTNAAGELQLERPAGGAMFFDVHSPGELYLGSTSEPTELPPGGDVQVEIQLFPGKLTVELPPGFALPEYGNLFLSLTSAAEPRADEWLHFNTESMEIPAFFPARRWTGERCELGPLAPGRYEVGLDVYVYELGESPGRYDRADTPPTILRGEVEVRAGAEARCRLRVER